MEAYLFMLIFAAALFLVAASMWFSKDPSKSIWITGSHKTSKATAARQAKQIARGVALVALVIAVGSCIGLIWKETGWWVILSGVIAAVILAFRISGQENDSPVTEEESSKNEENG